MGITFGLFVGIIAGICVLLPLVIVLAFIVLSSRSMAKGEAKAMLSKGKIDDIKRFEQISNVLSLSHNDLEARDLWHKLQGLKDGRN